MQAVCAQAIAAHASAMREQPWLKMIGWDAMLARHGPVFFEGNFAGMRLPRRVFLSWKTLMLCMREWSIPSSWAQVGEMLAVWVGIAAMILYC